MIKSALAFIVHFVETLGYPGIFVMTMLESTFLPIPSEVTLIPAGYLIHQGKMSAALVFVLSVTGTLAGSLINYFIARLCGRWFLLRYGRYFMMTEEKLAKMEGFFVRHGALSIFLGRLVLGVRHYISFPAGLARMDLKKFCLYTTAGGAIWIVIALGIGYAIGDNKEMVAQLVPLIKLGLLGLVAMAGFLYWRKKRKGNVTAMVKADEEQAPPPAP